MFSLSINWKAVKHTCELPVCWRSMAIMWRHYVICLWFFFACCDVIDPEYTNHCCAWLWLGIRLWMSFLIFFAIPYHPHIGKWSLGKRFNFICHSTALLSFVENRIYLYRIKIIPPSKRSVQRPVATDLCLILSSQCAVFMLYVNECVYFEENKSPIGIIS